MGFSIIVVFAWFSRDLPNADGIINRNVAQSTQIFDRTGKHLLFEFHGDERRTVVELADIPKNTISATLAAEDHDFYKHPGFDLRGIIRSIIVDVFTGSKAQGGSTITQQFVKNALLTNEKSYTRKIKELVLAYQLERKFTKDQILKLYFNEIPYGSNAYGIEAASGLYFGKSAHELDLAESALIAAIPQAPTFYSPWGSHQDRLVARQQWVLGEMANLGSITQQEADAAKTVDVLKRVKPHREENIQAPHFVFYVRDLLAQKYGEREVDQGGLKITTTLDYDLQRIAEEEVLAGATKNKKAYRAGNAAAVAIDPKTGQLLAMVGSRDYFDTANDGNVNVATSLRNPGSSFKPIIYVTAFERGYTPETILYDSKTNFGPDGSGKDYIPSDYDGKERGPVQMRQALAGSLNIPAVQTLYLDGIDNVLSTAERFGYTTLTQRDQYGLALALGGGGVNLLEHTSAFSVLAAEGVRHPVTPIMKIQDQNGRTLEEYRDRSERAMDTEPIRKLVSIMTDNNARSFIFGSHTPLVLKGRVVAAKTGTTNDWRDGWTVGFTPSLTVGIWAGNNDNSTMAKGADGVFVAAPIWNKIMERALAGKPAEKFKGPKPNNTKKAILQGKLETDASINVDAVTGKEIPADCLASWPAALVTQQVVKEVHSILHYVVRTNPLGDLPADPTKDPMYKRWEAPVQAWAKKQKLLTSRPAMESCSLRAPANSPTISFASPTDGASVGGAAFTASATVGGPNPIASVQYFLDDRDVGTVAVAPYDMAIPLTGVDTGSHTLKVTVADNVQNSATVSITISVTGGETTQTLSFASPAGPSTVSAATFPITISAAASHASGLASVSFLVRDGAGNESIIATLTSPADGTIHAQWSAVPTPGAYQLLLRAVAGNGAAFSSDLLPLTITP